MDISVDKVAQVILYAEEFDRAQAELTAFIEAMNEDEAAALVAVMWIGRGSFEVEEFDDALRIAREEQTTPTVEYLLGTPHLAAHLETGVELLGLDVLGAEEVLLSA